MRVGIITLSLYFIAAKYQVVSHGHWGHMKHDHNNDKINSLSNLMNAIAQKLDKQEYQEKQLGDELKKALGVIDNRMEAQNSAINAFKADLSTVKEELMKIEGKLDQKIKKDEESYAIDTARLLSWMSYVEGMLKKQDQTTDFVVHKDQLEKTESVINGKIDFVASTVVRIENELQNSLNQLKSAISNDGLHSKLESQQGVQEKWHNSVIGKLELLGSTNEELLACRKQQADNNTIEALNKITNEIQYLGSDKLMSIDTKLQKIMSSTNQLQNICNTTQELKDSFKEYFSQAKNPSNVETLTKGEEVLNQTAVNVLETRKRVESGIQEILLGIGELVKSATIELNDTFKNRFDEISDTIIMNQNNGVFNLTSKIDNEISQVWRLFGIVHEKLVNPENALNVSALEITSKVSDIKEKVNSLESKMLFLIQEFNQTKGELLTAFEKLRNNFESLHQDIEHQGPSQVSSDVVDVRTKV